MLVGEYMSGKSSVLLGLVRNEEDNLFARQELDDRAEEAIMSPKQRRRVSSSFGKTISSARHRKSSSGSSSVLSNRLSKKSISKLSFGRKQSTTGADDIADFQFEEPPTPTKTIEQQEGVGGGQGGSSQALGAGEPGDNTDGARGGNGPGGVDGTCGMAAFAVESDLVTRIVPRAMSMEHLYGYVDWPPSTNTMDGIKD